MFLLPLVVLVFLEGLGLNLQDYQLLLEDLLGQKVQVIHFVLVVLEALNLLDFLGYRKLRELLLILNFQLDQCLLAFQMGLVAPEILVTLDLLLNPENQQILRYQDLLLDLMILPALLNQVYQYHQLDLEAQENQGSLIALLVQYLLLIQVILEVQCCLVSLEILMYLEDQENQQFQRLLVVRKSQQVQADPESLLVPDHL